MTKYVLILIFAILFISNQIYISSASASTSAAASVAATSVIISNNIRHQQEEYQQKVYSNYIAPLDWAKEHNCILKYPDYQDREVGKYLCETNNNGTYILRTDGQGNINSFDFQEPLRIPFIFWLILGIIAFLLFIWIIVVSGAG